MFGRKRPSAPMSEERALERLAALCSAAEHCRSEMVEKATGWGLTAEAAERVADRLERDRFVDDTRFAPAFVRDKARFSGWGPVKIRMALKAKAIDENIIEDAMCSMEGEEWREVLSKALSAKMRTTHQDDPQKRFASVVRFGLQRGFAYEEIKTAYEEISKQETES